MQVPNVNVQTSLKYLLIQLIEFISSNGLCHSIGFNMYVNKTRKKVKTKKIDKFFFNKIIYFNFFYIKQNYDTN